MSKSQNFITLRHSFLKVNKVTRYGDESTLEGCSARDFSAEFKFPHADAGYHCGVSCRWF